MEDYGKIFLSVSIWTPNIAVRFQVDKPVSEFVEKKKYTSTIGKVHNSTTKTERVKEEFLHLSLFL